VSEELDVEVAGYEPELCVILNRADFDRFIESAAQEVGDPSVITSVLILEWREGVVDTAALPELRARWAPHARCIVIEWMDSDADGVRSRPVQIPVSADGAKYSDAGELEIFGVRRAGPGVYALAPSLNLPGFFHAFVVLHGVPEPPPWERRIILSTEMPR
jgi:hypothetical protein